MPISGQLGSGVAALKSFSRGLDVLGSNIANSSTVGYKGTRIEYGESFNNILQRSAASTGASSTASQVGTGVGVQTTQGIFTQGNLSNTGVPTDLGISGAGYFQVVDPVDGSAYITRAGNFRIDNQGYLVTQSGLRVQGLTGGSPEFIVTGSRTGDGTPAPAYALDSAADITAGVLDLQTIVLGAGNELGTGYDPANPPTVTVRGDGFGAKANVTIDPVTGAIEEITISEGGQGYSAATLVFEEPPGSDINFTLSNATAPGVFGDVKIEIPDLDPLNDFNNQTDDELDPGNPIADADLEDLVPGIASFAVNSNGEVQILLENGDFFTVGQVLMTDISDPQALVREGDNLFSGAQVAGILVENGVPGQGGLGVLQQSSLELSNVDLTEQFAELISTQRAFQAGSRIITTADTILQEVINLKR